jgi:hypothetical protein
MMNMSKLVAIAQIAQSIPRSEMCSHLTCAMGRSVAAGILEGKAAGVYGDKPYCVSEDAAKQLGILEWAAKNFFIDTACDDGRECSRRIMAYVLAMG